MSGFSQPRAFFQQVSSAWRLVLSPLPEVLNHNWWKLTYKFWLFHPLGLVASKIHSNWLVFPNGFMLQFFRGETDSIMLSSFSCLTSHLFFLCFLGSPPQNTPYTWTLITGCTNKLKRWREGDRDTVKNHIWCAVPLKSDHQKKAENPFSEDLELNCNAVTGKRKSL